MRTESAPALAVSAEARRLAAIPDDRRTILECTVALPTPDMLRAKMLRDGWKERAARHPGASIFLLEVRGFDEPFSLVLPRGETIGDGWRSSIIGALRTLAGLEDRPDGVRDRPPGDIAAEIIADAARRGRTTEGEGIMGEALPKLTKPQLARLMDIGRDRYATRYFMPKTNQVLIRLGLIEEPAGRYRPTPLGVSVLAGLPGPDFDRYRSLLEAKDA